MRIKCPYCGDRPADEFASGGAAGVARPEGSDQLPEWVDYAYMRDNPAGSHREWFYHAAGCRAWLMVTRDTRTHVISAVTSARDININPVTERQET